MMSSDGQQAGERYQDEASKFESEEQALKIRLLKAEIENKEADTMLKTEQTKWERYKAMSTVFGTAVAVAGALLALGAWLGGHLTAVAH